MIEKKLAATIFDGMEDVSRDETGVSRDSYGEVETAALSYLESVALEHGLAVSYDAGGNAIFSLQEDADANKYILVGSHIDSVPRGGNYDGGAGIVAGLLCLIKAAQENVRFIKPVKVIAIRGEESAWFGPCYVGSKALLGQLTESELKATHRDTGQTLEDAMAAVGVDIERVKAGEPLLDISDVEAFLELHIEQGPVLVQLDKPLAVVSGIRGNFRYRAIHCLGESGHSGAVPREYRHDAVFSVSSLLTRIDNHWKTVLDHGGDLVITSGIMSTNMKEHAMSRIPGDVEFSFEARSEHQYTLDAISSMLTAVAKNIERERQVRFIFDEIKSSAAAQLDPGVTQQLQQAAERCGFDPHVMPSGAGHDSALFSNAGIPTGMIFVRNENGSHNPDEAMDLNDFGQACDVLYDHLTQGEA